MAEPTLFLLLHPYSDLHPIDPDPGVLRDRGREPGAALVCAIGTNCSLPSSLLRARPGGLQLLLVLPPDTDTPIPSGFALELERMRPYGILPHHGHLCPTELAQVLRRPPLDLAADVTDYLRWRGVKADRDTTQLIRRILGLSEDLRSISAVSRSLYVSRRALGRRLTRRGLPVPSHWLQMGRLLRASIRLQNSNATIASVAFENGYPDGFSLSNQMERLFGCRPTEARCRLGWEWLVEAWLRREAESGRFTAVIQLTSDPRMNARAGAGTPGLRRAARSGTTG